jgi:hypothetical protein
MRGESFRGLVARRRAAEHVHQETLSNAAVQRNGTELLSAPLLKLRKRQYPSFENHGIAMEFLSVGHVAGPESTLAIAAAALDLASLRLLVVRLSHRPIAHRPTVTHSNRKDHFAYEKPYH